MKKYIVCKIQPFVYKQTIYTYDGEKCISENKSPLVDLESNLFTLCKKGDIHDIILMSVILWMKKSDISVNLKLTM